MGNSVNSDIIDCNAEVTQTSWHIWLNQLIQYVTSAPMMNGLKSKV